MGGVVSSGQNNDDLIDNLLEADYIKTSMIERVFRAVDRAEYFLAEARGNAYKDLAWKCGNLHLSAPCIYSEVMEGLSIEPGMSFMNLGSGTGYLSTMVGLILGSCGVNHGIEYHLDVVQYANKKLEEFKKHSGAIDEFDYCEPKFIQGNCLCLTSECNARYDRVYCGAACPPQYENYMKNLLKVGGILVMPLNDHLVQILRTSKTNWNTKSLLPVSFATLIQPPEEIQEWVQMIEVEPSSLQELCRSVVRNILRKNVEKEHPPIKKSPPVNKAPKKKRALRRLVVPLFESEDSSDDDRHVRIGGVRNRDAGRATFREESDGLLNFVLGTFREGRNLFAGHDNHNRERTLVEGDQSSEDNRMETDTNESTEDSEKKSQVETKIETQAVIEHVPTTSQNAQNNAENVQERVVESPIQPQPSVAQPDREEISEALELHDVFFGVLNCLRRERGEGEDPLEEEEEDDHVEMGGEGPSTGESREGRNKKKREKFDSGLGDEIVENHSETSEDVISSSDEDRHQEKRPKRAQQSDRDPPRSVLKWRRTEALTAQRFADSDSEREAEGEGQRSEEGEMRMYRSPYSEHLKAKIQRLPLPPILKRYLNFYREF
ncbi:unnamed protein product [Phaedon cochleariae]|uniref:Uncharacterized protein n=1 Tax=Phaedon cochleariae TaxID=80249 RepID=A0A9N9X0C4_PHACE|nr:unnamed protein product [Phaedon cochleariae]